MRSLSPPSVIPDVFSVRARATRYLRPHLQAGDRFICLRDILRDDMRLTSSYHQLLTLCFRGKLRLLVSDSDTGLVLYVYVYPASAAILTTWRARPPAQPRRMPYPSSTPVGSIRRERLHRLARVVTTVDDPDSLYVPMLFSGRHAPAGCALRRAIR